MSNKPGKRLAASPPAAQIAAKKRIEKILTAALAHNIRLRISGEQLIASPAVPELLEALREIEPLLLQVFDLCVTACHGLRIAPETLFNSLTPLEYQLVADGVIDLDSLRCYAEGLAAGRGQIFFNRETGQVLAHCKPS